jgi:hypothetical protein
LVIEPHAVILQLAAALMCLLMIRQYTELVMLRAGTVDGAQMRQALVVQMSLPIN